jgi:hypothetical protein
MCTFAEFRWERSPLKPGEILDVFEYLTVMPRSYGELESTVGFSVIFWFIYEGLGFRKWSVCTFAEFRYEVSPLEVGEISRFLHVSHRRHGDMAT